MIVYPPEFQIAQTAHTSLSPCLRALIEHAASIDEAKVVATLEHAARLAARVEPARADEFLEAAGFARGYMLGEEGL